MWSVTVDEQIVARLRAHDWSDIGAGDPFTRNRGPGDSYRIRMVNGRCFFLDQHNRCQIHNRLGYEAKPAGCRAFPLHYTEVAGESYARLSFYCPTASANRGKRLVDQMRWLRAVRKAAGDVARSSPLRLRGEIELTRRELDSIDAELARLLGQSSEPMHVRLAACVGLIREASEQIEKQGKGALARTLKRSREERLDQLAARGSAGGRAARAGPVFSLFLGSDCRPTKWDRLKKFVAIRAFNIGLARLRSAIVGANASRKQIEQVQFDPAGDGDALLTRYLLHKLEGKRHVAGDLDLLSGVNLLLVAYAVIDLLARAKAATDGREQTDLQDVSAAVEAADLLVVEHTTINQKQTFALLVETILAQPTLCGSMIARLGYDATPAAQKRLESER
jgi:hypothetical protein